MATVLIGKAPLTLVRRRNGTTQYVYAGQPAPGDALAEDNTRLLQEGYLESLEVLDPPVVVEVLTSPPAKSAAKADWVAWAVTQGMPEAEAKAAKKEDLVATFGVADSVVEVTLDPDALTDAV